MWRAADCPGHGHTQAAARLVGWRSSLVLISTIPSHICNTSRKRFPDCDIGRRPKIRHSHSIYEQSFKRHIRIKKQFSGYRLKLSYNRRQKGDKVRILKKNQWMVRWKQSQNHSVRTAELGLQHVLLVGPRPHSFTNRRRQWLIKATK